MSRSTGGDVSHYGVIESSADFTYRDPTGNYALRAQAYGSAISRGPTRTLPDGTRIGSGDLDAGASLRLSKQGGGHWLFDASVTAHSRKLDFNDLGFMERQNDVRGGAYLEYRTLEPWLALLETHTLLLAYGENTPAGLALGRGLMLMENVVLDNRWAATIGGYVTATRYDDREIGDGTALERSGLLALAQALTSDPRAPFVVGLQAAEERLVNGANVSAQVDLTWHPPALAELQLIGNYTYNFGEPRYAGSGASSDELVFGRLHADSAAVSLRAAVTFMPELTLQSYAQVFLAAGHYFDFASVAATGGIRPSVVRLSDLTPGAAPLISPDFAHASLALNVVLRWEYRLGSTLYLLYVRSQSPDGSIAAMRPPQLDVRALRTAASADVIMVKAAYGLD